MEVDKAQKKLLHQLLLCSEQTMEPATPNSVQNASDTVSSNIKTVISLLEALPVGESFTYQCKKQKLDDEWSDCKAVKQDDHFVVIFGPEFEDTRIIPFEDEECSLLSSNLWEIGWYRQMPVVQFHSDERLKLPGYCFGGKTLSMLLNDVDFNIYQEVHFDGFVFKQPATVSWDGQFGIFYFAAEAVGQCSSNTLAIVFNCTKNAAEMVPLDKINPSENKGDLDLKSCHTLVNAYLRSVGKLQDNKKNDEHKSIEMVGNYELTSNVKSCRGGGGEIAPLGPSVNKEHSAKQQPKPPSDDNSEMSASKKRKPFPNKRFSPQTVMRSYSKRSQPAKAANSARISRQKKTCKGL